MKVAEADLRGQGEHLILDVACIAPSLGWTGVSLNPVEYITPPIDGLQEFILSSKPPTGPSPSAVELFTFSKEIHCPEWFQGICIRSHSGGILLTLRNPVKYARPIGNDTFWITSCGIRKDQLVVEVSFPGGPDCQHSFQLSWDGIVQPSSPPQVTLELSHNRNSDHDSVLLPDTLQFDLSTIKGFPDEQIILHIKAPYNNEVLYYATPSDTEVSIIKDSEERQTEIVGIG